MKIKVFTAQWCNPCKNLKQQLEKENLVSNIEIIDVEQDREQAIKYGIRSIPTTVIVDNEGNVVRTISSSQQQLEAIRESSV